MDGELLRLLGITKELELLPHSRDCFGCSSAVEPWQESTFDALSDGSFNAVVCLEEIADTGLRHE